MKKRLARLLRRIAQRIDPQSRPLITPATPESGTDGLYEVIWTFEPEPDPDDLRPRP